MKRLAWLSLFVGFSGLLRATPSLAISLDLVPDSATVVAGDTLDVDVIISGVAAGAPPSVGGFDLVVSFDPTILSLREADVSFGPFLGDPALFEALTDVTFLPSVPELAFVNIAEVSFLSPAELDALQPASFTLATLSFSVLASGTTTLTFSQADVVDAFGRPFRAPLPSTVLLFGAGLAGLAAAAWRRQRRRERRRS
jgi:hypothetical protein